MPITIDIVLESARRLDGPSFVFHVRNEDGVVVFGFNVRPGATGCPGRADATDAARSRTGWSPGRYYLDCWVRQNENQSVVAVQGLRLLGFVVYGTAARDGLVTLTRTSRPPWRARPPGGRRRAMSERPWSCAKYPGPPRWAAAAAAPWTCCT